jgi:hypothetical protein
MHCHSFMNQTGSSDELLTWDGIHNWVLCNTHRINIADGKQTLCRRLFDQERRKSRGWWYANGIPGLSHSFIRILHVSTAEGKHTVEFLRSTALLYYILLCVTRFKCCCSHRIEGHSAGNSAARRRNNHSCACIITFLLVLDCSYWSPSRDITISDVCDNSSLCYCGFGTSHCQLT